MCRRKLPITCYEKSSSFCLVWSGRHNHNPWVVAVAAKPQKPRIKKKYFHSKPSWIVRGVVKIPWFMLFYWSAAAAVWRHDDDNGERHSRIKQFEFGTKLSTDTCYLRPSRCWSLIKYPFFTSMAIFSSSVWLSSSFNHDITVIAYSWTVGWRVGIEEVPAFLLQEVPRAAAEKHLLGQMQPWRLTVYCSIWRINHRYLFIYLPGHKNYYCCQSGHKWIWWGIAISCIPNTTTWPIILFLGTVSIRRGEVEVVEEEEEE